MCVVFVVGYVFVFSLFVLMVFYFLFCWCRDFYTHNEDIVTFRCGDGESRSCFLQKVFKFNQKKILFVVFLEFCTIFDWF